MHQQRALLFLALLALAAFPALAAGSTAFAQQPVGTVGTTLANVRSGPGTNYGVIGQAPLGTSFTITGRNTSGDWFQVCCISNNVGWIYSPLLIVEGSTAGVPVVGVAPPSQPTPTPPPLTFSGWRGEYFANRDLQGSPVFVRDDPSINFHWAGSSPGGGIPGTNFSVRWTRALDFTAGDYTFYAQVDDGVRLWLDNILILDDWRESSLRTLSNTFGNLGAGRHTVRVEYFQAGGDSTAVVWWEQAGQFPEWKGEYYNDIYLQGAPLLVRNDTQIRFQWSLGSPDPRVPADNFSVRWTRRPSFDGGDYDIKAHTNDGVRVFLDGRLIIDEWHDTEGYPTYIKRLNGLSGPHTVVVEYYERGGIAYAEVWWEKVSFGGGVKP